MGVSNPFGSAWWPPGCPKPGGRGWESLPLPDSAPILTARDVARSHDEPLGQPPYNLNGWVEATFPVDDPADRRARWAQYVATIAIESVVRRRTKKNLATWEYAGRPGVSTADVASAWNEAMTLLGYDMGGRPQAEPARSPFAEPEDFFS